MSRVESEAAFQVWAIDAAQTYGWRVAHFRPAMTSKGWRTPVEADGAGFFDLVLVHPRSGAIVFAECKAQRGRESAPQIAWRLATAPAASVNPLVFVDVWRPADRERILRLLHEHGSLIERGKHAR